VGYLEVSSHGRRSRPGTPHSINPHGGHLMLPFQWCGPLSTLAWGKFKQRPVIVSISYAFKSFEGS